ncbi:MAG: DUF4091 domain-containing protein [Candidatus Eremiobacteraeota bacterium]|nr:DUF4091 domain-containing protein [Candidatus Eremiobacteraeota bacterium]
MRRRALTPILLCALAGCARSVIPNLAAGEGAGAALRANSGAVVWVASQAYKVRPADPAQPKRNEASIAAARAETVAFQIVVSAKGSLNGVDVAFSDFSDGSGHVISAASSVEAFREFYLDLTHPSGAAGRIGEWPDGLVPIGKDPYYHEQRNGAPFAVPAGKNQAVWVDVAVPANAIAATYRAVATVTAGRATLAKVPVTLTVWNFTLPTTSSLATAFGLDTWGTYLGHYGNHWNTKKIEQLTNLYQAEALKHRISLYDNDVAGPAYAYDQKTGKITYIDYSLFDATYVPDLSGSLLPSHAQGTVAEFPDGQVSPPGPTPGPADAQYVAYWKDVAAHFRAENWLGRNFYYDLDEPHTAQDYQTVRHRADVAHKADPRIRVMDTTSFKRELVGRINIWTPIVNELDSPGFPPPSVYTARQKAGDTVWFYTSNESLSSGGPWPNFFVDAGVNDARIFSWMAWRYGLNGFLYYATTLNYTRTPDPWTNVYNFGDNGDGVLFYPGRTSLIGGRHDIPCPSIRLKSVRAALQDYEYMMLLHAKGQDAFVNALVRKLVTKTNIWTQDGAALEKARAEMAAEIQGT